ncbi:Eco57I restriction-modification methylase domain-containing protein [Microbacterium sp. Mu-80]|uniref:Eco57I restriction-modification methylase domain-containing protein n=1 Tax=Microbacterium bandirmense TaxID=3122050 RepID=A0ABU8LDI5_9MICO
MGKKFDVVIGNPPYQEEAQGSGTRDTPVYHRFMDAAYEVGSKVVLITPARFLFNAGFTPKAWNEKMLADPHLSVPHYVPNSNDLFPGTDIKGGIAVTYWDEERDDEPIDTFTSYPELNEILHKVNATNDASIAPTITSSRSFRYTDALYDQHPEAQALRPDGNAALVNTNTFEQFSFLYHADHPQDGQEYVQVLGLIKNRRFSRWILKDYITGPASFSKFKVVVTAANGSGALGEVLSSPLVVEPEAAVTQTFITIGAFDVEAHAQACLKYVKTKFARAMLGVLKITQHNPAKVWKYVPLQDFTTSSDIDWAKSVPEIDQQLYTKYGLDEAEIAFIEDKIKPME